MSEIIVCYDLKRGKRSQELIEYSLKVNIRA